MEKQSGQKSVMHAAYWFNRFFTIQNNQLYNIAGYLYPIHTLYVIFFVQLDYNTGLFPAVEFY